MCECVSVKLKDESDETSLHSHSCGSFPSRSLKSSIHKDLTAFFHIVFQVVSFSLYTISQALLAPWPFDCNNMFPK